MTEQADRSFIDALIIAVSKQSKKIQELTQQLETLTRQRRSSQIMTVLTYNLYRDENGHLGFRVLTPMQRPSYPMTNGNLSAVSLIPQVVTRSIITKLVLGGTADRAGLMIGDILISVNGQDLSNASREETFQALNSSEEPIQVEILRRTMTHQSEPSQKLYTSSSTQTDGPYPDILCPHIFPQLPSPPPLSELSGTEASDCEEVLKDSNIKTDCEQSSLEYEDVVLRKESPSDRIGLTLVYGETEEEGITDIIIGEVEADSIAAKDGRIREGDQIIQINRAEVHNRDEAVLAFSQCESEIQLLVCRPASNPQLDDGFIEEELDFSLSKYLHERQFQMGMPQILEENDDVEGSSTITDTATLPSHKEKEGKDSGVGHDSTPNDETSEQECDLYESNHSMEEHKQTEQLSDFRKILESRCLDLQAISDQLTKLDMEGNTMTRSVPKMGTKILHDKPVTPTDYELNPDTAYNTAESCKSHSSPSFKLNSENGCSTFSLNKAADKRDKSRKSDEKKKRRETKKLNSSEDLSVAYTTEENLAQTIAMQQQLLLNKTQCSTLPAKSCVQHNESNTQQEMEWVVKRRADGSRYIVKRPARARILSERKKRLEDERCGLTTDDDAMSELKLGRYWSKDQRRKHAQRARDYQRQKQEIKHKMDAMKKAAKSGTNIYELSQNRLNKHTMKDIDFTTVSEIMAHGFKIPHSKSTLLSVTTV